MQDKLAKYSESILQKVCAEYRKYDAIDPAAYDKYEVKRGLRNADGTGVMAGLTNVGSVQGYAMQDGERVPQEGHLYYRGIDIEDLINGFISEKRFGYEETAYLLLFGELPCEDQLKRFLELIEECRVLPAGFTEDMILKAPSRDIMNKLARSILVLYSYDPDPENMSLEYQFMQAIHLIARVPVIVAHAYAAKRHYYDNKSLYLHQPSKNMGFAENFLYSVRKDKKFTPEEAALLDLCLILHAEHGGGNNSAFACRVLSSSGTDTYSAISAAVGSLKGPKHGGANLRVMNMFDYIKQEVKDWKDDGEVRACLKKIISKQGGDGTGLVYGMGHAVYTLSDPRAVLLKKFARSVAEKANMLGEIDLMESIERLTPEVFLTEKRDNKVISANVDLYSGLVYQMLNIPRDLFTPLFAIARMAGWCAHRLEEVYNPFGRIIRPAYKALSKDRPYIPMDQRG